MLDYTDVGRSCLSFVLEISPLWLFGILIGSLSPKQPLLSDFKSFVASCLGVALGLSAQSNLVLKAMMCLHGMVFIQTLWLRNTDPGTFHRYLESVLASIAGTAGDTGKPGCVQDHASDSAPEEGENEWLITDADLDFFRARVERNDAPIRAEPWQLMVHKTLPNELQYRAYRRMLRDIKKTEYLSVSVTANSTPHEVPFLCFCVPQLGPYFRYRLSYCGIRPLRDALQITLIRLRFAHLETSSFRASCRLWISICPTPLGRNGTACSRWPTRFRAETSQNASNLFIGVAAFHSHFCRTVTMS